MRILVADDERDMALALKAMLQQERHAVDVVYDGRAALDYATAGDYDCLVLDIMMPRMDGLEVLSRLRSQGRTVPVLLLTAKGDPADTIAGLDTGADDYLAKPFNMGEFLARVRALTRRSPGLLPRVLTAGDLELDRSSYELSCNGRSVRLANKEYQILEQLVRQQGTFVSSERLRDLAWGYDEIVEPNVIWTYISYLRRKLESVGSACHIVVSRGRGYILETGGAEGDGAASVPGGAAGSAGRAAGGAVEAAGSTGVGASGMPASGRAASR